MNRRFLAFCMIGAALAPLACEKSEPPRGAGAGAGTSAAGGPTGNGGSSPASAKAAGGAPDSQTSDAAAARALAGLSDAAAAAAQGAATQALPDGHPPITGGSVAQPPSTTGSGSGTADTGAAAPAGAIRWEVPESWQSQPPASQMRKAQYLMPAVEGDPESGLCVVTLLAGGAGGVDANVARWVAQFKKADGGPLGTDDVKREDREVRGLKVTRVEMAGRFTDAMTGRTTTTTTDFRLLGAIVVAPDGLWFFKATGPDATMQSHSAAFDKLLESLTR